MMTRLSTNFIAAAIMLSGCGGSDGRAPCVDGDGRVELTVGGRVIEGGALVRVLPVAPTQILVSNVGDGTMCLRALALEPADGALTLTSKPWPEAEAAVALAPGDAHAVEVAYDPTRAAPEDARGVVRLVLGETTHKVRVQGATTALVAEPGQLDFGIVLPGTRRAMTVSLENTGTLPVRIMRVHLDGPEHFAVTIHGVRHRAMIVTARDGIAVSPPIEIAPGTSVPLEVDFESDELTPEHGSLRVATDELPVAPGVEVGLYANLPAPCLTISTGTIDFGGHAVGATATRGVTLTSCGQRDVVIDDVVITRSAGDRFALEDLAVATPIVIRQGESHEVRVTYTPTRLLGDDGPDRGELALATNTPSATTLVALTGFGSDGICPSARITCEPDTYVVAPLTTLRCFGNGSTDADGDPVQTWQWAAEGPDGQPLGIWQSGQPWTAQLEVLARGRHRISLDVWDGEGHRSCNTAVREVEVRDDSGLHIELTWRTPGDVTETDTGFTLGGMSVGSDLDLHVLHEDASAYFDDTGDTYWLNPTPNWAGAGSVDDPEMVRDDTDGGGPEIVLIDRPELDRTYTVGVHYWDDWGYGPALATLRVWKFGELVHEWTEVTLVTQDLWHALTIHWPSGEVHRLGDGAPLIEPQYPVPLNSGWPF